MFKRITILRPLLLAALCLVMAASTTGCDSGGEDENPTVTGSWTGTATPPGGSITINLQLTERDQTINGSGTISGAQTIAVSVSGTHNYPNVSLTISSPGLEALNFQGSLAGDSRTLPGNLSGSGFENFAFTLRKQ
jgi:hypothetical protein